MPQDPPSLRMMLQDAWANYQHRIAAGMEMADVSPSRSPVTGRTKARRRKRNKDAKLARRRNRQ